MNAESPSMLATLLTGAQPPVLPTTAPGRRHFLDDAKPGRQAVSTGTAAITPQTPPRDFTAADKALIRRVHGYMATLQLLGILNERLVCDLGDKAVLYTIDQLKAEIASVTTAVPSTGNDWGTLRKLLAKARREGTLDQINEQVIDDFAVIYSLNSKQLLILKDILLQPREEEEA